MHSSRVAAHTPLGLTWNLAEACLHALHAVPCVGDPTPDQITTSYREVPEVAAAAKEATSGSAPFQAALISPGWWEQQGAGAGDAVQVLPSRCLG